MPDLVQGIEIDNISGKIMLLILYSVIGFGMFGTFMMMTAERMYEFGVMMSVGMKRLIMQWTIFLEMAMLTSIGVLIGVGISLPILIYYYNNPVKPSARQEQKDYDHIINPLGLDALKAELDQKIISASAIVNGNSASDRPTVVSPPPPSEPHRVFRVDEVRRQDFKSTSLNLGELQGDLAILDAWLQSPLLVSMFSL